MNENNSLTVNMNALYKNFLGNLVLDILEKTNQPFVDLRHHVKDICNIGLASATTIVLRTSYDDSIFLNILNCLPKLTENRVFQEIFQLLYVDCPLTEDTLIQYKSYFEPYTDRLAVESDTPKRDTYWTSERKLISSTDWSVFESVVALVKKEKSLNPVEEKFLDLLLQRRAPVTGEDGHVIEGYSFENGFTLVSSSLNNKMNFSFQNKRFSIVQLNSTGHIPRYLQQFFVCCATSKQNKKTHEDFSSKGGFPF